MSDNTIIPADSQSIAIIGMSSFHDEDESRDYRDRVDDIRVGHVNITYLLNNLSDVTGKLRTVFQAAKADVGELQLEEIEIKLEVSAKGEIGLVGKLEKGATGGITLTYKRPKHNQAGD